MKSIHGNSYGHNKACHERAGSKRVKACPTALELEFKIFKFFRNISFLGCVFLGLSFSLQAKLADKYRTTKLLVSTEFLQETNHKNRILEGVRQDNFVKLPN